MTTNLIFIGYLIERVLCELLIPRLRTGQILNLNIDTTKRVIKIKHKRNKETTTWRFEFINKYFSEFGSEDALLFELH